MVPGIRAQLPGPALPSPTALEAALALEGIGVWTWDPATGKFAMSPTATALYGLTPEEAQREGALVARIAAEDRAAFDAVVQRARLGTTPAFQDFRVRVPNGPSRWVNVRAQSMEDGKRRILVGTIRDVTNRHEGSATAAAQGAGPPSAQAPGLDLVRLAREEALVLVDPKGTMWSWNAGAQRIFGHEATQAIGKPISLLYVPEDAAAAKAERDLEQAQRDTKLEQQAMRLRADGTRFVADMLLEALRDATGQLRGFLLVARDVAIRRSEQEHAEEAARLRAENEFKARFINMAAHELQTPLTPIRINLTLLGDVYGEGLDDDQRKCLEIIHRNVDRLARLVDDVLQAARLQANRLRLNKRPIDLTALVNQVIDSFVQAAAQVSVDLRRSVAGGVHVEADAGRIEQVLGNLLTNAIKFTPGQGTVTVRLALEGGAGQVAVLEVQDSGLGMTPQQLGMLFLPFSQVHVEASNQRGTGLGLFISKGIVEEHGGAIEATSTGPGRGSTFRVRLPTTTLPIPAEPAEPKPRAAGPTARRLRELI